MDLFFLVLSVFDGLIIGGLVYYIAHHLLGNQHFALLMKILFGVSSCIVYLGLYFCFIYGKSDVSISGILLLKAVPFVVAVAFWLVNYMYKNK